MNKRRRKSLNNPPFWPNKTPKLTKESNKPKKALKTLKP
jgi:hypothetical protein